MAFQLIPLLLRGLGALAKKIAPKLATKVTTSGAGKAVSKVAQGALVKSLLGSGGGGKGADVVVDAAKTLGKKKTFKDVAKNILTASPLQNAKQDIGTADLLESPKSTDELLTDMGMAPQRMSPLIPQIDKTLDTSKLIDMGDGRKSLRDIIGNIKGSKVGEAAQKLIGGDSFGSKLFLNTLGNMARQGAFSGSDVGQPDKDIGGMFANSLAGGLVQSARERRAESYEAEQNMMNMAADLNPAKDMYEAYQPEFLKQIDAFKGSITDKAIERRKQGGWLTSRDMLDIQNQYVGLKNKMSRFDGDLKQYMDSRQKMASAPSGTYDTEVFALGEKYLRENGRAPAGGFLEAAPKTPEQIFPSIRPTPAGGWTAKSTEEPWVERSALSADQKTNLAYAEFLSNPGLRKWAKSQGADVNNEEHLQSLAARYSNLIEPDRENYDVKLRMEDQRLRRQEQQAAKSEAAESKQGFQIVDNYPEADGGALVFDKNRQIELSPDNIETLTGEKIKSGKDSVIPLSMDYMDKNGDLYVTATTKDENNDNVRRRFKVPQNKAKGLLEAKYPGSWKAAEEKGFFKPKVNKEPVGVERMISLPGYGDFTPSELRAKGWTDEDIKKLK